MKQNNLSICTCRYIYIYTCICTIYVCTNMCILLTTSKNKFIIKISQTLTARKIHIHKSLLLLKSMELAYQFISYQRQPSCYNFGYQIRSRNAFNKFILQLLLSEEQLNCAFSFTISFISRITFSQPCFKIRSVLVPFKKHQSLKGAILPVLIFLKVIGNWKVHYTFKRLISCKEWQYCRQFILLVNLT